MTIEQQDAKTTINISVVFGTRPELVKLAPVIEYARHCDDVDCEVIFSGQHDDLVDNSLALFGIRPDRRLGMIKPGQGLSALLCRGSEQLQSVFDDGRRRDVVIAQGDTTTVLAAALTAFWNRIPFAHVEAGLRADNIWEPFPEEANRQLVSRISRWHFAPTAAAAANLRAENIDASHILTTGNTVVDAAHWVSALLRRPEVREQTESSLRALGFDARAATRFVLVTAHRRENFGRGIRSICRAIKRLARRYPDVVFVWPVHRNPNVAEVVDEELAGVASVVRTAPLNYQQLAFLLDACCFALTDSGGIQEECPSFGKPVLVLRDVTERPEVIDCGAGRLVGTDADHIVSCGSELLDNPARRQAMIDVANPFGDGHAARAIINRLRNDLSAPTRQSTALLEEENG